MASTVAQLFGALMAIIIAIGLFDKRKLIEEIEKGICITKNGTKRPKHGKDFKEVIKVLNSQNEIWERFYYPLQSMSILIIISLASIILVKTQIMEDYMKCFFLTFLFIFSSYTITNILSEVKATFDKS